MSQSKKHSWDLIGEKGDEEVAEKQSIPWKKREKLGLLKALWQTIKQVLFKPGEFFGNLEIEESYSEPLYFYLFIFIPASLINVIYEMLFNKGRNVSQIMVFLVLSPLIIFVATAFMHLGILVFKGKGGFKGTFNILAYGSAANVFNIIPFIGALVSLVWGVIIAVIGYKRVHKFSTMKALLSYWLFPLLLFVLALAATIAIPVLLRARLLANEEAAKATVQMIATAVETYAVANNGQYPSDEFDLRFTNPLYLKESYNNKTILGYSYSLNLNPKRYEIIATPSECGSTGTKIFKTETKRGLSEESCK